MGGIPNNRYVVIERRQKVHNMLSQGLSEKEIARQLNVGQSTICRDLKSIKRESQKIIESILKDLLPYEYSKSILSMEQVIKECWKIINDHSGQWTNKNKIDVLKLLKEAIRTKLEIVNQGPANLRAQQLEQQVKDLVEEEQVPQKSFFVFGPPPKPYEDLR